MTTLPSTESDPLDRLPTGEGRSLPWRLVLSVAAGTLLNPLNSSMIAVALLDLGGAFHVDIATATWLASGFYVGGAIGMPLMGRLADVFGARRVFILGLLLVGISSALAPLAPGFGWLLGLRVIQAFGTSAAYPAGLAIFRAFARTGRPPAGALGAISVASSVSAALGPVLGGGLVTVSGWSAIFLVNVPMTLVGLVLALTWLPVDAERVMMSDSPPRNAVRAVAANQRLLSIYAQFAGVNVVFYTVFFGLPLWLEAARSFAPGATGLLLLPVAGVGVVATPLAARLIDRAGPRPSLIVGSVLLLVGSLSMLVFDDATAVPVLVLVGAVLGVPNAFNNLGLQAALYRAAPPDLMGSAGGFFQTFRFVGAIAATALIGVVFGLAAPTSGLHALAVIMAAISALLVVTSAVNRL